MRIQSEKASHSGVYWLRLVMYGTQRCFFSILSLGQDHFIPWCVSLPSDSFPWLFPPLSNHLHPPYVFKARVSIFSSLDHLSLSVLTCDLDGILWHYAGFSPGTVWKLFLMKLSNLSFGPISAAKPENKLSWVLSLQTNKIQKQSKMTFYTLRHYFNTNYYLNLIQNHLENSYHGQSVSYENVSYYSCIFSALAPC